MSAATTTGIVYASAANANIDFNKIFWPSLAGLLILTQKRWFLIDINQTIKPD